MLKWVTCLLFFGSVLGAQAQTIKLTSCSNTDLQGALNQVTGDGAVIVLPAQSCSWTTSVAYKQLFSITIQGQTTCTGTPASSCTDNTTITHAVPGDAAALQVTTALGKSFRLTGITFTGGNANQWTGGVRIYGRSQQVRIDHVHFKNISNTAIATDGVLGVMDHDVFDINNNQEGWRPLNTSWNGIGLSGDNSWADDTGFGTNKFFFLEDSTVNGVGQQGGATNDCFSGGRYVVRHNVLNDSSVQGHTTGHAGDDRGCRAQEFYQNTMPAVAGGIIPFNAIDLESGPAMVWGNTVSNYSNFITAHIKREDNLTYTQTAAPNGWGYCGTGVNGTGSAWDQNSDTISGYSCIDQLGRGKGDLLSGLFPNKVNTALGKIAWPRQALEPVYEWNNTWSCASCGGSFWANYDKGTQQDRDYYLFTPTFKGTSGVGSGLLSARPSTCALNVAYWATDTSTLYQCSAPNTWTTYYKPYTYPHPLTGGSTTLPPPPPAAPTALIAVPK
jgi:hypothetical protein